MQALHDVATEILGRLHVEATLLSVVNAAARLAQAEIAGILLTDERGEVLEMRCCVGHHSVETPRLRVRRGQGLAGKVFETRAPWKVDDYLTDDSISKDFIPIVQAESKRSALGAPMIAEDELIGVLMVWRRRPLVFDRAATQTLINLANLATIAIVNARLYERQQCAVARLEEANHQLEEHYSRLRSAAEVHDALTELVLDGKGLGALVDMVSTHTGGQAAILDPELAVLASSGPVDAVRFRVARHQRRTVSGQATSVINPDADWARWLLMREVAAGGDRLASLVVSLAHLPTDADRATIEQAAIVCALELTKERAVFEARSRAHADFVWDLLEGAVDEPEAHVRARHLGYSLPKRLRVVLIPIDQPLPSAGPDAAEHRRDAVVRSAERLAQGVCGTSVLAARRGTMLALILEASEDRAQSRLAVERILQGLNRSLHGAAFTAGASGCVDWSADLRPAYVQARNALAAAPVGGGAPVMLFDDLGVLRFLLAPGDRGDLWEFARGVLGPVIDYDADHHTDLVTTVGAYLDSDCNLQRTAAELYVHPKTVRYRLDRIEELTRRDLSCQRDRFDTQLAMAIMRALSLEDPPP